MSVAIDTLLQHPEIWRARNAPHASCVEASRLLPQAVLPGHRATGFASVDALLPGGGWPLSGLIEFLISQDGIGEMGVLFPLLAACSQTQPIVLVAPPYQPCALHWHQQGVKLAHLHVVHCDESAALWATEQALRAGCCAAVLCWPRCASDTALRRLQIAASQGQCVGIVFRDSKFSSHASPAPVRVQLHNSVQGTQLQFIKCRGIQPSARHVSLPAVYQQH